MKKLLCALLSGLLALSLAGCAGEASPTVASAGAEGAPTETQMDALLESYYAGQNDRAYGMLQKHIFQSVLEGQAKDLGMERPVWNFDTFTAYRVLDQEGEAVDGGDALYCCTFSADGNRQGYVVLSFHSDGVSRDNDGLSVVAAAETPYLYDPHQPGLLDAAAAALAETGLDWATATAERVSLSGEDGAAQEGIRLADGAGRVCLCVFGEEALALRETK